MKLLSFKNLFPKYDSLKFIVPKAQQYYNYLLENKTDGTVMIIAFGSSITSAFLSNSDIDVLIVTETKDDLRKMRHLTLDFDRDCDCITVLKEDFNDFINNNIIFMNSLKNRSVVLYDRRNI